MPKSLIIQIIIGFAICMIALTLFVFSIIYMTLSSEFYQIATDGTVIITPEPGRTYFISVESSNELTQPELEFIYKNLIVTSDNPFGGFALSEAPGHSRSSRIRPNTSTHKASVSNLMFTDNNLITLNISANQMSPGHTLVIQSGDELTIIGIVIPLVLLLVGFGAGLAAGIRLFIWAIKMHTKNTSGVPMPGTAS